MGRKAANHSFCGATFAVCFPKSAFTPNEFSPFLTRELRACARASYRYDVGNGIRSLARSLARSIGRFL